MQRFDYGQYLKSPHWHKFRSLCLLSVFDRDLHLYMCESCKRKFPRTEMEVHHRHYSTVGNESREDVLVLCQDCHASKHGLNLFQNIPKSINGSGDANDRRNSILADLKKLGD